MTFKPGQRWISDTEPELGLGTVQRVEAERVHIQFASSGEQRQYAAASAPLRRVIFRTGESLQTRDGAKHTVRTIEEQSGLLIYHTDGGAEIPEAALHDSLTFGSPEQRLLNGQVDSLQTFELRRAALEHQHRRRRSPIRGFAGGRMDLIPHQLYIAREVTGRHAPRVLLADEVGLGKTVEACLMIHRLLATGRAARVLVVVPEPLVHQWFVELLRRFNLWFHIFDQERVDAIAGSDPEANPFLEDQLILSALPLLLAPNLASRAAEAGWDLLVVDEAHHLAWSPAGPSPEYSAIEAVSRRAEGLLLLTATPEQLGLEGHFARLRLLDPDRFPDFARFREESEHYIEVAKVANKLVAQSPLNAADREKLASFFGSAPNENSAAGDLSASVDDSSLRQQLVADLLDRHGTGRVMFRNTRAAMKGFPRRHPRPHPLKVPPDATGILEAAALEFEEDLKHTQTAKTGDGPASRSAANHLVDDPRVAWLASYLRHLRGAKILLITTSRQKVLALNDALRTRITVKTALFHEDLELVQRDRNAAWFAEPDGAQLLIASEIGSEGRNFQFAHHLVLFDLPLDPELVEQRIGRLDRIGQTDDIQIHVPYLLNSCQEVMFHWFHNGLNAFGQNLVAGRQLLEQFGNEVRDLAQDFHETHESRRDELETLIAKTSKARQTFERQLELGRDRLLELNSHRPDAAREIVDAIAALDGDRQLDDFLLEIWDHYGVPVEDLGPRLFKIGGDGVYMDSFPALPAQGLIATLERRVALSREDFGFLTWDHPMVTGALDLLLGSNDGNSCVAFYPDAPKPGLWLETLYVLECVAPAKLHADRFLPATPIRLVLDERGQDITQTAITGALRSNRLHERPIHEYVENPAIRDLVSKLAEASRSRAEARGASLVKAARADLQAALNHEINRLKALASVNPAVRPEEITGLETQRAELHAAIQTARLRLDSVRLILLGKI